MAPDESTVDIYPKIAGNRFKMQDKTMPLPLRSIRNVPSQPAGSYGIPPGGIAGIGYKVSAILAPGKTVHIPRRRDTYRRRVRHKMRRRVRLFQRTAVRMCVQRY